MTPCYREAPVYSVGGRVYAGRADSPHRRRPLRWRDAPYSPAELEAFRTVEQNTPLWLDMRAGFVGASEFCNVLNGSGAWNTDVWNHYGTQRDFMNWLAGRVDQAPELHQTTNLAFDLGHHFEPVAAARFADVVEATLQRRPHLQEIGILVDNTYPVLSASIDRWCEDLFYDAEREGYDPLASREERRRDAVDVEIKAPCLKRYKGEFPNEYKAQTQQQTRIAQTQADGPPALRRLRQIYLVALYVPYRELDRANRVATIDDTQPFVLDVYLSRAYPEWWDAFAWPRVHDFFDAYRRGETNYRCRVRGEDLFPAFTHLFEAEVEPTNETELAFA